MEASINFLHLLSATAQGDKTAFATLYQHTSSKLFAVSLQMLQRRDLAEDALQEAFVRIWHNAGDYQQEKGTVLTWMISIVRYRALDILRATKSRREETVEAHDDIESPETPEINLYQSRERVQIDHCLDTLDGPQRDAIQLAYFRGLTHFEVCDRMAKPLGSVKSWIRRGLDVLKRCLDR
ncbi:MAG TPA: sigma-70 family RNA polymerase sigma factor [Cellvibrionaceae bacterium]